METEKKQRLIYAAFVSAIVLFLLLAVIAVCQVVKMTNEKRYLQSLRNEKKALEIKSQQYQDEIEKWEIDDAIREQAIRLGLIDKQNGDE